MYLLQKTKQTIHNTARNIAKEVGINLNMEFDTDALDIIAELTYKKLLMYGLDLDSFQKHAKRSTITADDVKLLVRRNDSLKKLVESKLETINSLKPAEPSAKRKRKPTNSTS
ncbi:hypothetical protein NQ314_006486 [Rhamnusium bicolor]|uniref:Centromere protein S n=1 Tax=Rhamnusium bicolor TaxID=1586634 RepID=A0AAV8Z2B3_9CUCU|nr:hypothetical protein NQ314_006486 [Rhamnusium bicolor]